jgi:hypothetical protein
MLLVNSSAEIVPPSQSSEMRRALARVGVRAQTIVLPGHRHATEYASSAWSRTIAFLRRFDSEHGARRPTALEPDIDLGGGSPTSVPSPQTGSTETTR